MMSISVDLAGAQKLVTVELSFPNIPGRELVGMRTFAILDGTDRYELKWLGGGGEGSAWAFWRHRFLWQPEWGSVFDYHFRVESYFDDYGEQTTKIDHFDSVQKTDTRA